MQIDFFALRILVVDDQLLVRTLLGQVLRNIGFKPELISQATDGNNALRVLELRQFDVILCDIQMAPINGVDLLKEIRGGRTPNRPDVPFVFLSGHPERATILLAAQFHADGFIVKPPTPGDIQKNIEAALQRPRPAIDPFHYLTIPTGSEHDQRVYPVPRVPPQTRDLEVLLQRFEAPVPLDQVEAGAVLARDVCAADGRPLLVRGSKINPVQLGILKNFKSVYGVDTLPVAQLPQDQLIMYREVYGL